MTISRIRLEWSTIRPSKFVTAKAFPDRPKLLLVVGAVRRHAEPIRRWLVIAYKHLTSDPYRGHLDLPSGRRVDHDQLVRLTVVR